MNQDSADRGTLSVLFENSRLQIVFTCFVVLMGALAGYNQIVSAWQSSNIATREYVNSQIVTEDEKVAAQLQEIRDKGNSTSITHATELAAQTDTNRETHDQLTAITNKQDQQLNQMGVMSDRLTRMEDQLNYLEPDEGGPPTPSRHKGH